MKEAYLDLQRRFVALPTSDWSDETEDVARALEKLHTWDEVLRNPISLVIAMANAGKTAEFRRQTQLIRAAGNHAMFISVRELVADGELASAMEPDEAIALQSWQANPTAPLHVFVDSIDEASLERARDLRVALQKIKKAVDGSAQPVVWILSSRPAALNGAVLDAIGLALNTSFIKRTEQGAELSPLGDVDANVKSEETIAAPRSPSVAVYRLAKLSRRQATTYLTEKLEVQEPGAMMDAAGLHGMGSLLESPGRLNVLRDLDLARKPPSTLAEVYRRSIELHLAAPAGERKTLTRVTPAQLYAEAQRLAAASSLCNKLNIAMPSDDEAAAPEALSARAIVAILLDSGLIYLLSTGIFQDSGHHQVKLQPDDFRQVLAAQRLNDLINSREDARKVVRVLAWHGPSGESGVFPEWIPLAGWLATFNSYFRLECLAVDPQCVAFFGDLRSVPVADAERALEAAIKRLAMGERTGRGMYYLTSENYWQAGPPALGPRIRALFDKHAADSDVRERLVKIASYSRLAVLREPLLARVSSDYGKVLEDGDFLGYLLELGFDVDLDALTQAALAATNLDERTIRLLFEYQVSLQLTGSNVVQLLFKLDPASQSTYMLRYTLVEEVAPLMSTDEMFVLAEGLLKLLTGQSSSQDQASDDESAEPEEWVAEGLVEVLAQLASRELRVEQVTILAGLVAALYTRASRIGHRSLKVDALRAVLTANGPVRLAVLKETFTQVGGDLSLLWQAFVDESGLLAITLDEARLLESDALTQAMLQRADSIPLESVKRPSRQLRAQAEAIKHKQELLARIEHIRAGTDVGSLSWVTQLISSKSGTARYSEVSMTTFRMDFGEELADAVHEGLMKLWRLEPPRGDADQPRTVYLSTIAGLQGIGLSLAASSENSRRWPEADVQRALDYGLYEINGLPRWYWVVAGEHESIAAAYLDGVLHQIGTSELAKERALKIITSLGDASLALQTALMPTVWKILTSGTDLDQYALRRGLAVVCDSGVLTSAEFSDQARRWAFKSTDESVIWAAYWLLYSPDEFMVALSELQVASPSEGTRVLAALAEYLEDDRGVQVAKLSARSPNAANVLKDLYLAVRAAIPRDKDADHPPGKVFAVGSRETAERFRDRLPGVIQAGTNAASYIALRQLSELAQSIEEQRWLLHLVEKLAEGMRRVDYMTEAGFLDFERSLQRKPNSEEAFSQDIENDILDVKAVIESGEFSPRRFLASSFLDLPEEQMRAMEDEFQLFLAGQMELLGRHRYSVVREPQLAEDTRRDISVLHGPGNWRATLELKVSEGGWTLEDYRKALRDQLVGRYMKARNAKSGFLVILLQRERNWVGPTGKMISFSQLLGELNAEALALEREHPGLRLRVIGIDASEPSSADGLPLRKKARGKRS